MSSGQTIDKVERAGYQRLLDETWRHGTSGTRSWMLQVVEEASEHVRQQELAFWAAHDFAAASAIGLPAPGEQMFQEEE